MTKEQLISNIKRGSINIFSEETFDKKLNSDKKLIIKFGADPSRPDLHLGHSVVLRRLKMFQELGHQIVFVIGDFTAMIGDPTGKSKSRPSLTFEETRANGKSYLEQVGKILDLTKTKVMYNSEWLGKMTFEDVVKLSSKYTVARMLERDDFAKRYNNKMPISMHEMLYPLMQGYDSVALHADIEVGGSDQTFNLLVGRELQRDYGQDSQDVITFPLLVGLDGKEKMSKSLDNYIGIDEPANIMFEKAMKVPDNVLLTYFELTTDYDIEQAKQLIEQDIRQAHYTYATLITTMYHNEQEAITAKERYMAVASKSMPIDMPVCQVGSDNISIIDMVMMAKFAQSTSEARRLIAGGGIKIDGKAVQDIKTLIDLSEPKVLSRGKSNFCKFEK